MANSILYLPKSIPGLKSSITTNLSVSEQIKFASEQGRNEIYNKVTSHEIKSLIEYSVPAHTAQRSMHEVFTVVYGPVGAGKTQTLNNLFASEVIEGSKNKELKSTRIITEYRRTIEAKTCDQDKSVNLVGDLTFVDVPGFFEPKRPADEAINFAKLKKYGQNLDGENETKRYPNIVLLTLSPLLLTRAKGSESYLNKGVQLLAESGLVDINKRNLVVVITHACSLGTEAEKYNYEKRKLYNTVDMIIQKTFQFKGSQKAPIVFIENKPENYKLLKKPNSDFYMLPDSTESHKNLIDEIQSVFFTNKDYLGSVFFNNYFDPKLQQESSCKIFYKEIITSSTEVQTAKTFLTKLNIYVPTTDFCFTYFGYGYCPKTESVKQVKSVETKGHNNISILQRKANLADFVEFVEFNETKFEKLDFTSVNSYSEFRSNAYEIQLDIPMVLSSKNQARIEKNMNKNENVIEIQCVYTIAKGMFKFTNDISKYLENDIKSELDSLPEEFVTKDDIDRFKFFFLKYGTHVVSKQSIGGFIIVTMQIDKKQFTNENCNEILNSVDLKFKELSVPVNFKAGIEHNSQKTTTYTSKIQNESVVIIGGKPPVVTSLDDVTREMFNEWEQSILSNPVELELLTKLEPYYNLVGGNFRRKAALHQATSQYLGSAARFFPRQTIARNNLKMTSSQASETAQTAAASQGSCFPSKCNVWIGHGNAISVARLTSPMKILTLNLSKTSFVGYLHYDPTQTTEFMVIICSNNQQLHISPDHLLFYQDSETMRVGFKPARLIVPLKDRLNYYEVEPVWKPGNFVDVVHVSSEILQGVYAPLTASGTLIVDGFYVSCYAVCESHGLGHISILPLIAYKKLGQIMLRNDDAEKRSGMKSSKICTKQEIPPIHPYALSLWKLKNAFSAGS